MLEFVCNLGNSDCRDVILRKQGDIRNNENLTKVLKIGAQVCKEMAEFSTTDEIFTVGSFLIEETPP